MSIISFLSKISAPAPEKKFHSIAPMKLWQGTAVDINQVNLVLLQTEGGILPKAFKDNKVFFPQTIVAVGKYSMPKHDVYRSYFSDGKSFLQTAVEKGNLENVVEQRFYTLLQEAIPSSTEEWDFLLADEDGYVGYPFFDVGDVDDGGTRFPRLWSADIKGRIEPVSVNEFFMESEDKSSTVKHKMMQHGRQVGDISEYIITDVISTDDSASFDVFIGMDVSSSDITVMAASTK